MTNLNTVLIGASENTDRYSNRAIHKLIEAGHEVIAVSNKAGKVGEIIFNTKMERWDDVDTVTIYLAPEKQAQYLDSILALKPRRVIFNPGAENIEMENIFKENGIEVLEACTLVLLATKQF